MESVSSPLPSHEVPGGFPLPLLVVMRLAGAFRKVFVEELAKEDWVAGVDAAPPMFGVLRAAAYLDGPSQRDIAATIGLDPSDLVGILDRMQGNGWIVRERDSADRRRYVVRTTETGREVLERYNAVARRSGERMMAELDDAEREQFTASALTMLRAAGDDLERRLTSRDAGSPT